MSNTPTTHKGESKMDAKREAKIRKAHEGRIRIVSIEDTGKTKIGPMGPAPVIKITCECSTVVPGGLSICLCRTALSDPARYEEMVENHKAGRKLNYGGILNPKAAK